MASSPTLLMRLVASAYSIAQKAGTIVRRVIAEGDLGIVEKVLKIPSNFTPTLFLSWRVSPLSVWRHILAEQYLALRQTANFRVA